MLGTPPALILSQDQTLKLNSLPFHLAALAASLQDQLVNASDLALALFVLLCSSGLFRCLSERLDGIPQAGFAGTAVPFRRSTEVRRRTRLADTRRVRLLRLRACWRFSKIQRDFFQRNAVEAFCQTVVLARTI